MAEYDTSLGTLMVGIFFNTFLYGLVTYQFIQYYRTKFNDRRATKCMVFFLFVLDTFHSASAVYMAWYYTVANYDNPTVIGKGDWPYPFTPAGTALTALITQMYLGHRIWRFTESKFLFIVIIVLAIPSFVLGMVCSIEAWIIWVWADLPRITPLVISWLALQVAVDGFITITLTVAFLRSRTGFHKTDTVLNRLIRGAVQTGLFAGIFSIGDLLTFALLPSTNLYGMFAIPIGRIYTNTLMDTLLSRGMLKAELHYTYDVSAALDQIQWVHSESSQASSKPHSHTGNATEPQVRTTGSILDAGDRPTSGNTRSKCPSEVV